MKRLFIEMRTFVAAAIAIFPAFAFGQAGILYNATGPSSLNNPQAVAGTTNNQCLLWVNGAPVFTSCPTAYTGTLSTLQNSGGNPVVFRAYNSAMASQTQTGSTIRFDGGATEIDAQNAGTDAYTGGCPMSPDTTSGLNGSCFYLSAGSDAWVSGYFNMSFNVFTLNQSATSHAFMAAYNGESDSYILDITDESASVSAPCRGNANLPNGPCLLFETSDVGTTNFPIYIAPDANYGIGLASIGLTTGVVATINNTNSGSVSYLRGQTPTVTSGFGSSPAIGTGSIPSSITLTVGTGGTASTGVIGLPTATNGWVCHATDQSHPGGNFTEQSASSASSATLTNYNSAGSATAWSASDVLVVSCFAH